MKPRDNQKSRVYAAGRSAFGAAHDTQSIPNDELEAWVTTAMNRRPIRSRWGNRRITVTLKRGGRALGHGSSRISLPKWGRNPYVICHELAHCLTPGHYADHGPEFAGVFLFLVKTVVGAEAGAQLKAAYRANRVRSNSKAIPAVRTDVPSPLPVPKPVKREPKPQRPGKRQVMRIAVEHGIEISDHGGDRWDGYHVEAAAPTGQRFAHGGHYHHGHGDTASNAWNDLWTMLTYEPLEPCDHECDHVAA